MMEKNKILERLELIKNNSEAKKLSKEIKESDKMEKIWSTINGLKLEISLLRNSVSKKQDKKRKFW